MSELTDSFPLGRTSTHAQRHVWSVRPDDVGVRDLGVPFRRNPGTHLAASRATTVRAGGHVEPALARTTAERSDCGLDALAAKGWVPPDVAEELTSLYRAHREVEHRLQMVNDAQTHSMPTSPEGVARIAAFCGQTLPDFRRDLLDRLSRTDRLTEGFFAPGAIDDGPELSDTAREITKGWESYPALRSDRAQAIFQIGRASCRERV